jgi:hypothetical protein
VARVLAALIVWVVLSSGAAASPVTRETATAGAVQATVSYVFLRKPNIYYVRLVVDREGQQVYDARVPSLSRPGAWNQPLGSWGKIGQRKARTITLSDLDGDGEPEILLEFWFGGAHCCFWTRIYRWDPGAETYTSRTHFWGNFDYDLQDLNRSGMVELVSADNRFAYQFSSFAFSGAPVQVWNWRGGLLVDTTRAYPALVARDAAFWWRTYTEQRRGGNPVRGFLAAWAADEALLGRGTSALAWLGDHRFAVAGRADLADGRVPSYLSGLRAFLRHTGYLR